MRPVTVIAAMSAARGERRDPGPPEERTTDTAVIITIGTEEAGGSEA
jgi:hypothetical protein